jgi:tetratricopeptide (TPR) repeat protein
MRYLASRLSYPKYLVLCFWMGASFCGTSPHAVHADESSAQVVDAARIDQLIRELGAEEFPVREEAEKGLRSIGIPAFSMLSAAQKNEDVEVRLRARYLVDEMRSQGILSGSSTAMSRVLTRYADRSPLERKTLVAFLSQFVPYDATLELVRIAQFESDDWVALDAALSLIEKCSNLAADRLETTTAFIQLNVDESPRQAVRWLKLFAESIRDPKGHLAEWEKLVSENLTELQKNLVVTELGASAPEEIQRKLQFIFIDMQRRAGELEAARSRTREQLSKLSSDDNDLWLWIDFLRDRGEFQSLVEIKSLHAQKVASDARLSYLIAEALRRTNDEQGAKELVDKALKLSTDADERIALASLLQSYQGQFDWAESEYQQAIEMSSPGSREDLRARILLGLMYHDLARDHEAAETLQKLVDVCKASPAAQRLVQEERPLNEILGSLYHYRAEAAKAAGNIETQIEFLEKGFQAHPQNIDLLIAMYQVDSAPAEFRSKTLTALAKARNDYEQEIATLEKSQTEAYVDSTLPVLPNRLPTAFNDYAWLVANTEGDFQAALKNSQRSLELSPAESAYMDTLARCYFAVNDLPNAVKYQRMAVERSPNVAQMQRQLKIFEGALAKIENASDPKTP